MQWGWVISLIGVSAIMAALVWIDPYTFPICSFCALVTHPDATAGWADLDGDSRFLGFPCFTEIRMFNKGRARSRG
jgi:hypothetical protein